jgi:diguanylate cyclase (GGDEF)-like protein/PAS domain S-box-containing protein
MHAEAITYIAITLTTTYDVRLVTLSIVIAIFGSYIALDLAGQISLSQGWARRLWLTGGTIALGISIWAMHFIAMLAYQLPIPIVYDLTIVFVSMAVAIAGASAGLFVVSRKQPLPPLPLVGAAMSVGLGIVGLHLTAMASMRVAAIAFYEPKLMALSVATAIGGSGSALWLAFRSRIETLIAASWRKIGGAILMGAAIVCMHYLAMAAVSFEQTNQLGVQSSAAINNPRLAVFIGIGTLTILILTLLASFFGQRSSAGLARAEALRQSEERFRSLVQNASDVIAIVAADCTVSYLSPSIKRILGYEPEARLGKNVLELVHPEDLTKAESLLSEVHCCPAVNFTTELRLRYADVSWRDFEVVVNNLLAEPSVAGIVATCRDITNRKQAESALSRALKEQETIMEVIPDIVYLLDQNGNLLKWNKKLETTTGLSPQSLRGRSALAFFPEVEQANIARAIKEVFEKGKAEVEGHLIGKDEVLFPYEWNGVTLKDEAGNVIGMTGIGRDIAHHKQAEAQLREHAFHDALTSLPNRALFMDRLQHALNQAKRQKNYLFAVLFLDLDRFKVINDSLGHIFGDQLLIAFARRLTACLRHTDTAARLGGDEFTILLEGIKDISEAVKVADRIQAELRLPFALSEQEVYTTASIGIALSTTSYDRPSDLLRDADIAMYRAKARGIACYEIFNTDMHIRAVARLQLENDLRRAFERQEFQVYYQPIVSLKIGRIIGFEALVRWQHPSRGLVFPEKFLSVVEETGLIVTLDQWVLRTACHQMRSWQLAFPVEQSLIICVNFCSKLFAQPDLIEQVNTILQETCLDASSLKLEITESAIVENAEFATAMLLQLKALGIQLAIDDFGTGYSSLARLHSFPINVLKIDRSFISHTGKDISNLEIVRTIVTLAHTLGMHVTAEGVETAEQLARLRELNCEYGQGYFFSPPLDRSAAESLIMAQAQW